MIRRAALRIVTPVILILVGVTGGVGARDSAIDELTDSIDAFLEGALRININARIVDSGRAEAVWMMDLTRVTIGGRSVRVQLDGANIVVVADFTPYWESEDELLLLAQGQTWVTDQGADGKTTYRTSFTTLPIRLGEPIIFLPLGTDLDTNHLGQLNIELEIYVERYQS